MKTRKLGRTGLDVSVICLGTMTWGDQNTEAQAHEQLDFALDAGVNFIDTAEMYPVPPKPETQGLTEQYIGSWLAKSGKRDRIVLATKATGPSRTALRPAYIRGGRTHLTRENITEALNLSLSRLKTDYVDLYQLHWPDRSTNMFGQLNYRHVHDEYVVSIEKTLEALDGLVKSGKVRHVGISNETPWGMSQYLYWSAVRGWPRIASVQNPYSLVNRSFEIGLSEMSIREEVGLLAYSPLAFGALSGKYLGGALPAGARLTLFERFVRYNSAECERAIYEYVKLFRKNGIDPAHGALAYVNTRDFVASTIIGATTIDQLRACIGSVNVELPQEVLDEIEAIHRRTPNPAP